MELKSEKIKISDLIELKKNNMLAVNAEYQRGAVWSENQQKKLIDSVLRNYPLPLIYLHHKVREVASMRREDLEIIDGQQRINALYKFSEGALKLFDPILDDKVARFPTFVKLAECPWAHKTFDTLDDIYKQQFLSTELFVVKLSTDNDDEARDLFIRLQAGLPLNAQEKRDAWPGGYTEFVLKFGGKSELARYPGHDFFQKLVEPQSTDRGKTRQLCAQIGMLFFEDSTKDNWLDIGTQGLDDYYYKNLSFDNNNPRVKEFGDVLDRIYELLGDGKRKRLKAHEAIHLVLLVDLLMGDYTRSWETSFNTAFDEFRNKSAIEKKNKKEYGNTGEYWNEYLQWTQSSSDKADGLRRRHNFFVRKMFEIIKPKLKDPNRLFGVLEKEIIYYRDKKKCGVCSAEIRWEDLQIHHIEEHQHGGETILDNGVSVHIECHPKGQKALDFAKQWNERKQTEA